MTLTLYVIIRLKNDPKNVVNFHCSSQKSENLHLDKLVLLIAYKVSAKNIQKNDLSLY